jgi:putative ABC transport system permease protein
MLVEAAVLAAAGGALGLLLAGAASVALRVVAPDVPRIDEISMDGTILWYCLGATVAVALSCGVLPAARTARYGIAAVTGQGGRTQVSTRNALQWLLVCTQVALSVTLLAGAGLLVRSFQELSRVSPGFDPARILTFRLSGNWGETTDYARLRHRIDSTLEILRALPGVEAAATSGWSLPGVPEKWQATFELVEARDKERRIVAEARSVSPEYFETMQIPLVSGEICRRRASEERRRSDGTTEPGDLLVNRAFANRYPPGGSSSIVGMHLALVDSRVDSGLPPGLVVGVVGDAREQGLDREPQPTVYWCDSTPNPTPFFVLRTRGEPMSVAAAVRRRMKEVEPLRAVYDIAPLEQRLGEAFSDNRLRTVVISLFALTALTLASVGVYGMLSYSVGARRREIGLRLALGAARLDVVREVMVHSIALAAIACACGLPLATLLTRFLAGMLYGVTPADPPTLAVVVGIVLAVAVLASLVPAARAALVEPMRVLRES